MKLTVNGQERVVDAPAEMPVLQKMLPVLNAGKPALLVELNDEEKAVAKNFQLLTDKPTIFACNVKDDQLATADQNPYVQKVRDYVNTHLSCEAVVISAQLESDLVDLSAEEATEFLKEQVILGWEEFYTEPHLAVLGTDLLATDSYAARCTRYRDGTPIYSWGRSGSGNGEFNRPIGIATDRQNAVYVADTLHGDEWDPTDLVTPDTAFRRRLFDAAVQPLLFAATAADVARTTRSDRFASSERTKAPAAAYPAMKCPSSPSPGRLCAEATTRFLGPGW